jgi:DNA polymerase III alpha subunit
MDSESRKDGKMKRKKYKFSHLHVHTEYSLFRSTIKLDALFEKCRAYDMDSVAITDLGDMFGVAKFYEKARMASIKPLIGCEVHLAPRSMNDREHSDYKGMSHLVLLAKDMEGYKNLCKLVSLAYLKGFYYEPRIDKSLLENHSKGLIGLSACLKGEIPKHIINNDMKAAQDSARFFQKTFGENNFFLEIQQFGLENQHKVNEQIIELGNRLSAPVVATNNCHYLSKNEAAAYELLRCIHTGDTYNNSNRLKSGSDQQYFKSTEEMVQTFGHYPQAIDNTQYIVSMCTLEFDDKRRQLPKFVRSQQEAGDNIPNPSIDIEHRNQMYQTIMDHCGGYEYVGQVVAFEQFDAKTVIKEVGRALEVPSFEIEGVIEMLPDAMTIFEAVRAIPEIRKQCSVSKNTMIEMALLLEALLRHISSHPTVVAIADKPLYEYLPVCRGDNGEMITQFDIIDIKRAGVPGLHLFDIHDSGMFKDEQLIKAEVLNNIFAKELKEADQWGAEDREIRKHE